MREITGNSHNDDAEPGGPIQPEWNCVMRELENVRAWLLARIAPQDPHQYLQVDQASRLLIEVLLAQDHRRWTHYDE